MMKHWMEIFSRRRWPSWPSWHFHVFYFLVGRLAPRVNAVGGKLKSYRCGEDIPAARCSSATELFFFIALFFTMMHVAALVVATLPPGPHRLFRAVLPGHDLPGRGSPDHEGLT